MHDHEHSHHHDDLPHEHVHEHDQGHSHEHTHEHAHTHEHTHGDGQTHTHPHAHEHAHPHTHEAAEHTHTDGSHEGLLKSKAEAAAFLRYTLTHNAHHDTELDGLVHSLQHLSLDREAAEVASCIDALKKVDERLEAVLAGLK
jgi:hypothetical protein